MIMNVFKDYANFYDILYREKNYSAECDFLEKVFSKFCKRKVKSILDLGGGTGSHTIMLSKRGYDLTCVDQSKEMLSEAKRKIHKEKKIVIDFIHADIRRFDIKKKYDAVILMFAVMSYQTRNSDVQAVFKTINKHLQPNGVFFFDCWFGPAVISKMPSDRIKKINLKNEEVIRLAQPNLNISENTVTVNYTVFKIKEDQIIYNSKESHVMRYFFPKEIEYFANHAGLKVLNICPFMSLTKNMSLDDWNMAVIGTSS